MLSNENGHTNLACNYRRQPVNSQGCICNRSDNKPQAKVDWKDYVIALMVCCTIGWLFAPFILMSLTEDEWVKKGLLDRRTNNRRKSNG